MNPLISPSPRSDTRLADDVGYLQLAPGTGWLFVEDDRGLHRNNRGFPEESMKQVMQLVHDRDVTRTDRVHLDDLAFEQLHPLVLRKDADLAHLRMLLKNESGCLGEVIGRLGGGLELHGTEASGRCRVVRHIGGRRAQ